MAEAVTDNVRPRGEARNRDDEELLLLLLLISATDVERGAELWDLLMPPRWRGLLSAVAIDDVRAFAGELPPIWFDRRTQRYGLGNRGVITLSAMFEAIDTFRDVMVEQQRRQVAALYAGAGTIGSWQTSQEDTLKLVAIAAVTMAVGGIAQVEAAHRETASKSLEFQIKRLARFAEQIERGLVSAEAAQRRAAAYPESIISENYDEPRRLAHIAAGMTEESNVLDPEAEHCRHDPRKPNVASCPELTERGWVPIGTLPAIGKRVCKWKCRCHLAFRVNQFAEV